MSFVDKVLNAMRLNDDEYYDEELNEDFIEDDEIDDEHVEENSRHNFVRDKKNDAKEDERNSYRDKSSKTAPKITPISRARKQGTGLEVCVIKPTSMDDAREITETLLSDRTVVLNVEGLDVDVAQRIIDFSSGSCFAISGNLQKISSYIFIITPANVDISGDFQQNIMDAFHLPGYSVEE